MVVSKPADDRGPLLSIIVLVYDMAREARRTLHSLTPAYQEGVESLDYEVIVVDNGSPTPLGEDTVRGFGDRFVYHYVDEALSSPCRAMNEAVDRARGSVVAIAIDGARLFSPGVLRRAVSALQAFQEPVVVTLSFELGSEPQQSAITHGYDKAAEDALLAEVGWPADGYRLFDVAVLSTSAPKAPFRSIGESNCLFLRKSLYRAIGGMNEAFNEPGGGLANLDLYTRAVTAPGVTPVVLLGEGTFHQIHGGASTGVDPTELSRRLDLWFAQYHQIVGSRYAVPRPVYEYMGHVPPEFVRFLAESAKFAFALEGGVTAPQSPPSPPAGWLRSWLRRLKRAASRLR
jgi:glycosyltransferase involved in cell wall biosynthesis